MKAYIRQLKGITLNAKADSNHWLTMDGGEDFGGSKAGSGPMEMVLMALGGCSSMDIIPILKKKRVPIEGYEVYLDAERATDHPKVFTNIKIEFVFYGKGIEPKDIERAIELSTSKYCSVYAMLSKSVNITHTFRIEEKLPD
jgi:putative redox protein